MLSRVFIFLLLNFAALAIGGILTGKGVPSEWYASLNKAPWTPPGWVFGFAWTSIMICFAFFLAYLYPLVEIKRHILVLFAVQWILNVAWNPVFFHWHAVGWGLVVISALTLLVGYMFFFSWPLLKLKSVLLLPYFMWLIIATSLNGYIFFKN